VGKDFQIGEWVEIKSKEEILATLDAHGDLEALPFMPEMLELCGRRMRVYRRVVKTCDTVHFRGMHRMRNSVHLEGSRCSGKAHGGCAARCLLFWKQDWLRPASQDAGAASQPTAPVVSGPCDEAALQAATLQPAQGEDQPAYRCQATEMPRAAPCHMPWWDPRQYVRDVQAGNATTSAMMRSLLIMLFNKFQSFDRKFLPGRGLIRGAQHWPFLNGPLRTTPNGKTGLQPGDIVRVRTRQEIVATLNPERKNRGLSFDAEMVKYCGKELRVLARVEKIIDEKTGRMIRLPNGCVILDGAVCVGDHNQFCRRGIYPYWREIWLDRVSPAGSPTPEPLSAVEPVAGSSSQPAPAQPLHPSTP
jgi:hypothetical protein